MTKSKNITPEDLKERNFKELVENLDKNRFGFLSLYLFLNICGDTNTVNYFIENMKILKVNVPKLFLMCWKRILRISVNIIRSSVLLNTNKKISFLKLLLRTKFWTIFCFWVFIFIFFNFFIFYLFLLGSVESSQNKEFIDFFKIDCIVNASNNGKNK